MAEAKLPRKLGYFSLTNIVIANMIGAGIFTTSGLLLGQLHNPILLLALWLAGGGIATVRCIELQRTWSQVSQGRR